MVLVQVVFMKYSQMLRGVGLGERSGYNRLPFILSLKMGGSDWFISCVGWGSALLKEHTLILNITWILKKWCEYLSAGYFWIDECNRQENGSSDIHCTDSKPHPKLNYKRGHLLSYAGIICWPVCVTVSIHVTAILAWEPFQRYHIYCFTERVTKPHSRNKFSYTCFWMHFSIIQYLFLKNTPWIFLISPYIRNTFENSCPVKCFDFKRKKETNKQRPRDF